MWTETFFSVFVGLKKTFENALIRVGPIFTFKLNNCVNAEITPTFRVYDTKFFFSVFESLMCIKNDTYLKTCLNFLKTSFFADKTPYFSLQNCPGDWDRIYRIVTSIDLIAFPRTQCFCYKSPQNVDTVHQYRDLFETSKTYSKKEQVGEKMELFNVLSNQTTKNICDVFSSFVLW